MNDGFANNDDNFEHVQKWEPPPKSSLIELAMAKLNSSAQDDSTTLDTSRLFYEEVDRGLRDFAKPNDWYWDSGC